MKRILVVVDSFENVTVSSPLLAKTIELARVFSGKVWLLHVVPPMGHSPFNIDNDIFRREVAHELKQEHKTLQHFAQLLRDINIDAAAVMLKGDMVKSILGEAEKLDVDLIILGCHMHGELVGVLTRDTAKTLLGKCALPVMFIPVIE